MKAANKTLSESFPTANVRNRMYLKRKCEVTKYILTLQFTRYLLASEAHSYMDYLLLAKNINRFAMRETKQKV